MAKESLILMASTLMDSNKNKKRNEQSLIRMASTTRKMFDFSNETLEVWDANENNILNNINNVNMLHIFKAFTKDVNNIKKLVKDGKIKIEDIHRIGFVTSHNYKKIIGNNADIYGSDALISDSIVDIVIGSDPEFVLMDDNNQIISARTINNFSQYSPIGHDGAMAELRPNPGITPEDLVANIKSLFSNEKLTKHIKNLNWHSGVYYKNAIRNFPIGGHIHISNPAKISALSVRQRSIFFIMFTKILDELLALPMIRLDGVVGAKRRATSYGGFGDIRLSAGHLEYRTLSGAWLSHPILAETVFGTVKAISEEIYNLVSAHNFDTTYLVNDKIYFQQSPNDSNAWNINFAGWGDIPLTKDMQCIKSSSDIKTLLTNSKLDNVNKNFINKWYKHMQSLTTYNKYSTYIDRLYAILSHTDKDLTTISTNLKTNWCEEKEFSLKI